MDIEQERSPILMQDLGGTFCEPGGTDGIVVKVEPELTAAQKKPRRFLLLPVFGAGLLLGWLVIGWWVWPIQWTNSNPWQLQPKFQRIYVSMVAEEYWRTSDVLRAKESLAGWDRAELNGLLNAMRLDTTDAGARRHLSALAEALDMPTANSSWVATLLSQRAIIVGAFLVIVPLAVAMVLVAAPYVQKKTPEIQEAQAEAGLEELLADVQLEGDQVQASQAQEGQPLAQDQLPDEEQQEREMEEEDEEGNLSGNFLGDLASLFEEEDTSLSASEAMCEGLVEIAIADLAAKVKGVVRQLQESNTLRTWDSKHLVQ
jgi:hypothetical protein